MCAWRDYPGLILATMVSIYWSWVVAMSVRLRRRTRRLAGIVPEQTIERIMWIIWLPLVAAWIALPWQALLRARGALALPEFARQDPYAILRWLAAATAVGALLATIRCWREMGRSWTMAVTPGRHVELITTGMFARVRHPIYALSIALMLCTLAVVPTWPVAVMAVIHIALMAVKARNEERFLLAAHDSRYAEYRSRTGRFLPRFSRSSPS